MVDPLFSVIVPVYGVADFIENCIESVLNQTYENFELVLIDDGSKDGSGKICDKYSLIDTRVKVIHKENGGVTSARKMGVKNSLGAYIVFLDGDDFLSSDYLSCFQKKIIQYKPEVLMDGCVWWESSEKQTKSKVSDGFYGYPLEEGEYNKIQIEKIIFPHLIEDARNLQVQPTLWGKAFLRELISPVIEKIDDSIKIGEDSCIVKTCIFKANSFYVLGNTNYFYRQLPGSALRKPSSYNWDSPELISKFLEENIDITHSDLQEQVYRLCVHLLFNVYRFKKSSEELHRDYYKKAIRNARFKFGSKGWFACILLKLKIR